VIDPFLGNVFPNFSKTDFDSNRSNWEMCGYSGRLSDCTGRGVMLTFVADHVQNLLKRRIE
jgi:hypothetical protein